MRPTFLAKGDDANDESLPFFLMRSGKKMTRIDVGGMTLFKRILVDNGMSLAELNNFHFR